MRRYMLVDGVAADELDETDELDRILARALRLGSGPLVYVGRAGLAESATADDGVEHADALGLAAAGNPPIAILVGAGEAADAEARRFAVAGWQVATLDAAARDPWATVRRIGAAA